MTEIADTRITGYEVLEERNGLVGLEEPVGPRRRDRAAQLDHARVARRRSSSGSTARSVFDLSVDYFVGMPSWAAAGDPKYDIWMTHTPQGSVTTASPARGPRCTRSTRTAATRSRCTRTAGRTSTRSTTSGYFGCFWNGWTAEKHLGSRHWMVGGADKYPKIIARGVLLDIAGLTASTACPDSYEITPDDREGGRASRASSCAAATSCCSAPAA